MLVLVTRSAGPGVAGRARPSTWCARRASGRRPPGTSSRCQTEEDEVLTALLVSFAVIFVAELGDKSQLMAMTFATRYRFRTVLLGITAATAVVHLASVAIGRLVGNALPTTAITVVAGLAFLLFAAWTLRGDELDDDEASRASRSTRSA